jgi:glycosyltransferase involved in cell wall biosynthesis
MDKKVTVTIPSYKQLHLLMRALDGLQKQTFKEFSVIIIDDATDIYFTDLLKKYAGLDISVIRNEKNLGAMGNEYKSITYQVKTPYILSLHEDDVITKEYLEHAVLALDSNQKIQFACGKPIWVQNETDVTKISYNNSSDFKLYNARELVSAILEYKPIIFGSVVYRRSSLSGVPWKIQKYKTLCDRIFLLDILQINNGLSAVFEQPKIFVRNHDHRTDKRADGLTTEHIFEMYEYYKNVGGSSWKALSNNILYSYSQIGYTNQNIYSYITEARKRGLLRVRSIRLIGIYSILISFLPKQFHIYLLATAKFFKKMK